MRITRLMGLATVLVALAAAVNALAFKTATVTNPTTFTVDTTSAAALAFAAATSPGTGFTASIPTTGANQRQLEIVINDKMQPNSVYRFTNVFKVTNTATGTPATTLGVDTSALPAGVTVTLYTADGTFSTPLVGQILDATTSTLSVDVQIAVDAAYTGSGGSNLALKITGTQ